MPSRILIVDDSWVNRQLLETILHDDHELAFAATGEECLEKVARFKPDLVLLDIVMPGIDGYETCRRIKSSLIGPLTQVILCSTKSSTADRLMGYEVGADSYIVKPFDPDELVAKVRVHLRLHDAMTQLRQANAQLHQFNSELETLARQRAAEVIATRELAIFALAQLAESRDPETGEHLERMRNYSRILAEELGARGSYAHLVDATFIDDIYRSSPLHDIGKVGIPDSILLYPDRLVPEEFEIMKRHTVIGAESLRKAAEKGSCGGFLAMAHDIARHHHEHYDGKGYPDGLAGDRIPLAARIVAVADVFDALTSRRVYKPAYHPDLAKDLIERGRESQFDPVVVSAFLARCDQFLPLVANERTTTAGSINSR